MASPPDGPPLPSDDAAFLEDFLATHPVRLRAISLPSWGNRWQECEAYLQQALPPPVLPYFAMFRGINATALGRPLLPDVDAIEAALGCRLYRDWPIMEATDVKARFPHLASNTDVEAWVAYERMFEPWWRDRQLLYLDFYCRHLTFGDVGCSLSHLALWEAAAQDSVTMLIVFEDDARPKPGALTYLFRQIQALERIGTEWDLIYGHSTKYDKAPEAAMPGCALLHASHRKLTDFYILSSAGIRKLLTSGFRNCILPIDDFLPALFRTGVHPRPDVMALGCVRYVREICGGLAAYTVSPDVVLSINEARRLGSASAETPCILGHGRPHQPRGRRGAPCRVH